MPGQGYVIRRENQLWALQKGNCVPWFTVHGEWMEGQRKELKLLKSKSSPSTSLDNPAVSMLIGACLPLSEARITEPFLGAI